MDDLAGYTRRLSGAIVVSPSKELICDRCHRNQYSLIMLEKNYPINPDKGVCYCCFEELFSFVQGWMAAIG